MNGPNGFHGRNFVTTLVGTLQSKPHHLRWFTIESDYYCGIIFPAQFGLKQEGKSLHNEIKICGNLGNTSSTLKIAWQKYLDGKHRKHEFDAGERVFPKFQPYRQVSVALRRNAKLVAQ